MISSKVDSTKKQKKHSNFNRQHVAKRSFDSAFKEELLSSHPNSFKMKKVKKIEIEQEASNDSETRNDHASENSLRKGEFALKHQHSAKKSAKLAKDSSHQPQSKSVACSHVLLLNFDLLKEEELRGFLKKRGVNPEKIACVTKPVAIVSVDNEDMKKALLSCAGVPYKSRKLATLLVSGDISDVVVGSSGEPSGEFSCVFASMLPKSFKRENIEKIIGFKPKAMHLLTTGPKNIRYNACFIECSTPVEAKHVVDALNGHSESGVTIRAVLRRQPRTKFMPVTETSLVIENFPFTCDADDVRREFPTAISVESARKGQFHLNFETKSAREEAAATVSGKQMGGRRLRILAITSRENVLTVNNLPYSAEVEEVKALYPLALNVSLCKLKNGKPTGSALIYFASSDALQAALNETATKHLQGRQLRAVIQGKESKTADQPNTTQKKPSITEKSKSYIDRTAPGFKKEDLEKDFYSKPAKVFVDKNKASKNPVGVESSSDGESESDQEEPHSSSNLKTMGRLVQKINPNKVTKPPVVAISDSETEDEDSEEEDEREPSVFYSVPQSTKTKNFKTKPVIGMKATTEPHNFPSKLPIQVGSDSEDEADSEDVEKPVAGFAGRTKEHKRNKISTHINVDLEADADSSEDDSDPKMPSLQSKGGKLGGKMDKPKPSKVAKFPLQVGSDSEDEDESESASDVESRKVATKRKEKENFPSKHISMNDSLKKKHHHSKNKGGTSPRAPGKASQRGGGSSEKFKAKWKNEG